MTPIEYVLFFSILAGFCMWIHDVCLQYGTDIVIPVAVK